MDKKNKSSIYSTFNLTYVILLTTATITIIEAISTSTPIVRHILNLETAISIIAGYFYGVFITKVNKDDKDIDWNEITELRYVDWSITTPLMLITLCLVLGSNSNTLIRLFTIISIIGLNYLMLLMGYLGEINVFNKITASILGFIPFFGMFYLIFINYVKDFTLINNNILFGIYIIIWSIYGVVYNFNILLKNGFYNILDLIAKCIVGLGLWAYYTKIIN
jgi:bacteriorhodopsin